MDAVFRKIRRCLTGIDEQYILRKCDMPIYDSIKQTGLYVHIPYCKSLCPYCPYNKILWNRASAERYNAALQKEIAMVAEQTGRITVESIYFGGGTPTLCMDILTDSLAAIRNRFDVTGDICVETGPNTCGNDVIARLRDIGVNQLSMGIQSFHKETLQYLGRNGTPDGNQDVIQNVLDADFDSLNVDMMFAIPGQSSADLLDDLNRLVEMKVPQITLYPLFTFPYSSVRSHRETRKVRKPSLLKRRSQFKLVAEFFRKQGYIRSSIWSFRREGIPRYSSATRESYIGLGCGAGSHTEWGFFLNTFDVNAYIERCEGGRFPTALSMRFSKSMHQYFWLYWRLYDTYVSEESIEKVFGSDDVKLNRLLKILEIAGWLKKRKSIYRLNDTGAFWVHLLQNRFILEYINKTWSVCTNDPWPEKIAL